MVQKVYGVNVDNGDGSITTRWYHEHSKPIIDKWLDEDAPEWREDMWPNEGEVAHDLTFPDDVDLTKCGFVFSD